MRLGDKGQPDLIALHPECRQNMTLVVQRHGLVIGLFRGDEMIRAVRDVRFGCGESQMRCCRWIESMYQILFQFGTIVAVQVRVMST